MSSPIIIRFATDVEPARRGMASLSNSVTTNLSQMNMALSQSAGETSSFLALFASLQGPVDSLLNGMAALQATSNVIGSIGQALNEANERMERTLQIAQGSRGVGVGASFFQSLTLQAKQLGVETGTLTGLLERARDAAAVKLGVGQGAKNESAIQDILGQHVKVGNIGQADKDLYDQQTTQEGRIRVILDLMDKLKDSSRQLAAEDIGRAFFGDDFDTKSRAGIALVEALRKALSGMDVAGGVRIVSDEEVERTQRMQVKIAEINDIYARGMKPILDDIAAMQDKAAEASLEWQLRVANMVAKFAEYYQMLKAAANDAMTFARSIGQYLGIVDKDKPEGDGQSEEGAPLAIRVKPRKANQDLSVARPGHGKGGSKSEDPDSVEAMIRALNKARDVAQAELEAVGKTVTEREKLLALARAEAAARDDFERGRRASAALDDDERNRVLAAAEALGKAKAATQDLEQAERAFGDTVRHFGSELVDVLDAAIDKSKDLGQVLRSLISSEIRNLLSALLTGTGPLASLIGTAPNASAGSGAVGGALGFLVGAFKGSGDGPLQGPTLSGATLDQVGSSGGILDTIGKFLGFRANGGPVRAGGLYTVNEIGDEIFVPNQDGRIMPIARNGAGGFGGGPVDNSRNFHVDARGAQEGVADQIVAALTAYDSRLDRSLAGRVDRSRGRYGHY